MYSSHNTIVSPLPSHRHQHHHIDCKTCRNSFCFFLWSSDPCTILCGLFSPLVKWPKHQIDSNFNSNVLYIFASYFIWQTIIDTGPNADILAHTQMQTSTTNTCGVLVLKSVIWCKKESKRPFVLIINSYQKKVLLSFLEFKPPHTHINILSIAGAQWYDNRNSKLFLCGACSLWALLLLLF